MDTLNQDLKSTMEDMKTQMKNFDELLKSQMMILAERRGEIVNIETRMERFSHVFRKLTRLKV